MQMLKGRTRIRRGLFGVAMAVGLSLAIAVQAGAHVNAPAAKFFHGYWGSHAVVTGTVSTVSSSSFIAEAYVITPGAGGSSSTPTETRVTITPGSKTKLIVNGKSVTSVSTIAAGDDFYAVYKAPASEAIGTITAGTPTRVSAFPAPTPEFLVEGTITAAPTTSDPDEFTATAKIVQPRSHGRSGFGRFAHRSFGAGYSYGRSFDGFGLGHVFGGKYGFSASRHTQAKATTGVEIQVDATTKFDVGGNKSATVGNLAVGQKFVAVFAGAPANTSLSSLTPALDVYAKTVYRTYSFSGTVKSTSTTTTPETVTVAVTRSAPKGLFTGDDTFTVGAGTRLSVRGHALTDVAVGDRVEASLRAPVGDTAAQLEALPLGTLTDLRHFRR
jgi:hypothetical protein